MALPLRTLVRSGALRIPGRVFGAGGRGSALFPIMEALIEIPELLVAPRSRIGRVHTRAVRDSMKRELQLHHRRRIPEHFNRFRQRKYRYAARSPRVQAVKKHLNQADLVKSARTKKRMTREITIRFPRSGGQGVQILGILKWPVGFRRNTRATRGVTQQVMIDEISRWTIREERDAAQHVMNNYVDFLDKNLSRRARIRLRPQLGRLGIKV